MKNTTERTPVILNDGSGEAATLINRLRFFNKAIVEFKAKFNEVADGLNQPFSRYWLQECLHGKWRDKLGEVFGDYLAGHPKFLHSTLSKEYINVLDGFEADVEAIKKALAAISTTDSMGRGFPPELTNFHALPIGDEGRLEITQEYEHRLCDALSSKVETTNEHKAYDAILAFFEAEKSLVDTLGQEGAGQVLNNYSQMGSPLHNFSPETLNIKHLAELASTK